MKTNLTDEIYSYEQAKSSRTTTLIIIIGLLAIAFTIYLTEQYKNNNFTALVELKHMNQ